MTEETTADAPEILEHQPDFAAAAAPLSVASRRSHRRHSAATKAASASRMSLSTSRISWAISRKSGLPGVLWWRPWRRRPAHRVHAHRKDESPTRLLHDHRQGEVPQARAAGRPPRTAHDQKPSQRRYLLVFRPGAGRGPLSARRRSARWSALRRRSPDFHGRRAIIRPSSSRQGAARRGRRRRSLLHRRPRGRARRSGVELVSHAVLSGRTKIGADAEIHPSPRSAMHRRI